MATRAGELYMVAVTISRCLILLLPESMSEVLDESEFKGMVDASHVERRGCMMWSLTHPGQYSFDTIAESACLFALCRGYSSAVFNGVKDGTRSLNRAHVRLVFDYPSRVIIRQSAAVLVIALILHFSCSMRAMRCPPSAVISLLVRGLPMALAIGFLGENDSVSSRRRREEYLSLVCRMGLISGFAVRRIDHSGPRRLLWVHIGKWAEQRG